MSAAKKKKATPKRGRETLRTAAEIDVARELVARRIEAICSALAKVDGLPDDLRLVHELLAAISYVTRYFDNDPQRATYLAAMATAHEALSPGLHAAARWYLSASERAARVADYDARVKGGAA